MAEITRQSRSGITVSRETISVPFEQGLQDVLRQLDTSRGVFLSSGYDYPGRRSRWDIASVRPPLEIVAFERQVEFRPLNLRGETLNKMFATILDGHPHVETMEMIDGKLLVRLRPPAAVFPEEERSKQPSAFSIIRALIEEFGGLRDEYLALIGAFGFDLLYRFDPVEQKLPRESSKDLQLFLCDDIWVMDRKKEVIHRYKYEFEWKDLSTRKQARTAEPIYQAPRQPADEIRSDHEPGEYARKVEVVREGMRRGDYYEVVLRQTYRTPFSGSPSWLFERIQEKSPSPYEFLLQLGDEQLVGASPEMFVRVEGRKVETSPISGTAKRTDDPLKDAENIRNLLASRKEESELTMCTDVDRNDKSRVSVPGSVVITERRFVAKYAGLFHTVDLVVGELAEGFDSIDAFLTHMWAVTMIGAPKRAAAQAIENLEKDSRGWYGGAVGMISLSGDINTGILIRTAHLRDGFARYPVGATLLYDSDPASEEAETRLKAEGFFRAMREDPPAAKAPTAPKVLHGKGVKLLLVDNADCFIHTLSNYVRQTGAEVVTYRAGFPLEMLGEIKPDLILVSPGPGRPRDFGVPELVLEAARRGIPLFGVCLGLQGVVEAFGGELGVLNYPMHGKTSTVRHYGKGVFAGLPEQFRVGRYHSLYAIEEKLPDCLEVTAVTVPEEHESVPIIMGVRHKELPIEAVQFHPESLLTLDGNRGLQLMENVVKLYGRRRKS